MKEMNLARILTDAEVKKCIAFYEQLDERQFVDAVEREVFAPNLSRINATVGQKNDARYLAYATLNVMRIASNFTHYAVQRRGEA